MASAARFGIGQAARGQPAVEIVLRLHPVTALAWRMMIRLGMGGSVRDVEN